MSRDWDDSPWACGGAVAAKSLRRSTTATSVSGANKKTPPQVFIPANLRPKASKRLRRDKWRAAFDTEGKPVGFHKLLKNIISGGVDHSIRAEVWEFLLGCYGLGSTTESRKQTRQARRLRYKELIQECQSMHSSVGTGSLAYTVGSKVMDVRIRSKDSSRKEAKSGLARISLDSQGQSKEPIEQQMELPSSRRVSVSDLGLSTELEYLENFGSGRNSSASALSVPLYNMSSPSAHANEDAESEVSDFSFTNGDYIGGFPYLPTVNLFAKEDSKGDTKSSRTSKKSRGDEQVSNLSSARSESRDAFPRERLSKQENSTAVLDVLGIEEDKHMIYGLPVTFDEDPTGPDPSKRPSDVLGSSFPEVSLSTLDDGLEENAKPTGTSALDFTYSIKNGFSEEKVAEWLWTLHRIVIDVVRTDRDLEFYGDMKNMARMSDILAVYAWIDSATGYCQGMSDLLSPFIVLFDDDADAFWCFESLLRRVRQNFQMEGPVGVMKQLETIPKILELTDVELSRHFSDAGADSFLFAFRMLLVLFRRELSFGESLFMWEMMWASDFNPTMVPSVEGQPPGPLVIRSPSMSLQERLKEDDHGPVDWRFNVRSANGSPREHGNDAILHSKSPFCGLRPGIWTKPSRRKSQILGGQTTGDEELSVFCVVAILVLNRAKLLKEVQSMDDAIRIFNDMQVKIRVQKCIETAIRLRKRYSSQLVKRPTLRRTTSLRF